MKNLARLQQTFQDCVLQAGKADTASWISAKGRADPEIRLSVYIHAYRGRLKEVLANDYPAVLMAIGDNQFNRLADDYIDAHPSLCYSLRDFGHHLPAFVAGMKQQYEDWRGMHWLHELSLFERTLGQAFDAADDTAISEQDLAGIAPEAWPELRFHMHPSVHRLDLEWNISAMWQALTADSPVQVTAIRESASPWLVWRDQLITRFRSMQGDEQLALDQLRAGNSFSQACEALTALMREDQVPLRAAGLLKSWMAQGLISGIQ
jgi:hypothetical protein